VKCKTLTPNLSKTAGDGASTDIVVDGLYKVSQSPYDVPYGLGARAPKFSLNCTLIFYYKYNFFLNLLIGRYS